MVKSCCAYGCTNRFKKDSGIRFFLFPSGAEIREKWVKATRRQNFQPSKHTFICSVHFKETDYMATPDEFSKKKLRNDAVPSIFDAFPSYYKPPEKKKRTSMTSTSSRDQPSTSTASTSSEVNVTEAMDITVEPPEPRTQDKSIQTEATLLPKTVAAYRTKVKALNQTLRRKNKKISNLKDLVASLKKDGMTNDELDNLLLSEFSGCSREIFFNVRRNQPRLPGGARYSQELKKFALTLYYNSPRAYKYCRPILKLPHAASLANWMSNVEVQPGFFKNVFDRLKELPEESKDCTLIIDAMAIRKQVIWSPSENKFLGYCDYGSSLHVETGDVPATEALVFMLVGLKSHWKWPIGYFLQNKSSACVQANLIKSTTHLSKQAGLRIHGITFDGTSTNFASLNSLGCNFYGGSNNLKANFTFNETTYYAIPDPCHMLKLARNCVATLGKIRSPNGIIDWAYIMKLYTLQNSVGLNSNRCSSE